MKSFVWRATFTMIPYWAISTPHCTIFISGIGNTLFNGMVQHISGKRIVSWIFVFIHLSQYNLFSNSYLSTNLSIYLSIVIYMYIYMSVFSLVTASIALNTIISSALIIHYTTRLFKWSLCGRDPLSPLNSQYERPPVRHVLMVYGIDVPTEVGYSYIIPDGNAALTPGGGTAGIILYYTVFCSTIIYCTVLCSALL